MSNEPEDPFAEKQGMFRSMAERIEGDLERRIEQGKRLLPFHHDFLDDMLRGIRCHDLILLGAWSGIGKTQKATQLAMATSEAGGRVAYIALEAEENEIEARAKFQILAAEALVQRVPGIEDLNFPDWSLGRCEAITGHMNEWADAEVARRFGGVETFYKASRFDLNGLRQTVMAMKDRSDLVVLDHLHYVDVDDDNENRGLRELTKTIRDCALTTGKPVVVVVHLRKRATGRTKVLVPTLDDIHGSSDIAKICTRAIMLAPAPVKQEKWFLSPTFVTVPKDRVGGATQYAAVCQFDRRTQSYVDGYALGRLTHENDRWDPVYAPDLPRWAKGADRVFPAQGAA